MSEAHRIPTAILRYPYEAITETTDFLQLSIFRYDTNANGGSNTLVATDTTNKNPFSTLNIAKSNISKSKVLTEGGVIALPMPSNIQDSNAVSYESGEMNNITAAGLKAFNDATAVIPSAGEGGVAAAMQKGGEQILKGGADFLRSPAVADSRELIMKALSAQAVNIFGANVSVNQLLARSGGKILNPNMELLFNNVTLRTFRFSFKMTPRDENEATSIKSIIRTLKRNMAAKNKELFLETPNIFELQYKKGNRPHPFLNLFQPCALSDMSVNYTGENVYATYADGTPISMIMTLTFKELFPIYQGDYGEYDADTMTWKGGKASFNGKTGGNFQDTDLIYGVTGDTQNDNVQGVGL
jgi:hypothetical protein